MKKLTHRELEILSLIDQGLISKEVACVLKISTRTVETHRRNIHEKLNVRNATAAIYKARQLNVLA